MDKVSYEKVDITQDLNAVIKYIDKENIKENPFRIKQSYIPPHWHRSIEFSLVCKGEVDLWINNHKNTLKEGDFIFINSGQVHKLDSPNHRECEVLLVILSYDFLKRVLPDIDNIYFDIKKDSPKKKRVYEIYEFFKMFSKNPQANDELMINAYIYELLYILINEFQVDLSRDEKKYVISKKRQHKILDYIEENHKEDLNLTRLAEVCHMSEEHFSRVFREYFGTNFKTYLTNYRLYCSYNDVVDSTKSMQNIAFDYGFSNVKSFISAFKDSYSMTPYQYRKRYQESKNDNTSNKNINTTCLNIRTNI